MHVRFFLSTRLVMDWCEGHTIRTIPLLSDFASHASPVRVKILRFFNLFPRVFHLTAPWSERGKTLADAGHVPL